MIEYLQMAAGMSLFSLIAIWLHALKHTWGPNRPPFISRVWVYENQIKFALCGIGLLLFSLAVYFYQDATNTLVAYLGFGWATGFNALIGFVIGALSVTLGPTLKHPLREG